MLTMEKAINYQPVQRTGIRSRPNCGTAEAKRAIEAANLLGLNGAQNIKRTCWILRPWYELMMENQEDLARLMTAEQGKPLTESIGEIAYAASFVGWFGEEGSGSMGILSLHMQQISDCSYKHQSELQ
ncbi:MAG: hypothetical protein CM1200mP30_07040 [Pseudomonadota bacterium]|nr:MAG: hypothetical protein CM1200mP30_07040 [Pseudomonadota bacterium]